MLTMKASAGNKKMEVCIRLTLLISALLFTSLAPVYANDSTASLKTGNLVLQKTTDIAMESEDLYISLNQVRVRYAFRNLRDNDVSTVVTFPIPAIISEEQILAYSALNKDPDFLHFQVMVDGQPVAYKTQMKHVSVNPAIDEYDIKYYWNQTFRAHSVTIIEHTYRPYPEKGYVEYSDALKASQRYCVDKDSFSKMRDKIQNDLATTPNEKLPPFLHEGGILPSQLLDTYLHYQGAQVVDYILKTANNWARPIGHFTLTVDKGDEGNMVSSCMPGLKPINKTQLQFQADNFSPQNDLVILFMLLPSQYLTQ